MRRRVLILGCGYTGKAAARALLAAGHEVIATSRRPERLRLPTAAETIRLEAENPEDWRGVRGVMTPATLVLNSIPSGKDRDFTQEAIAEMGQVSRLVYLSTTGVYGDQRCVDALSEARPVTDRDRLRVAAEEAVRALPSALVLRPAAIYGPHRGIHESLRRGKYKLAGDGQNFVSRIHVDDLATHAIAGLFSDVTGAFPVADDEPCRSREIAAFCAELLHLPMPESAERGELPETRRADRQVDGTEIRRRLGVTLRFPSYRAGIPASIAAEEKGPDVEDTNRAR